MISGIFSRPIVWGYANARAKAMRPALLGAPAIASMLEAKDAEGIIATLERTDYREDLTTFALRFGGEELIELATGRNFARAAATLLKVCPKQGRPILFAILSRFDVQSLKAVILAKKLGKEFATVEPYLVPAGSISLAELQEIYNQDGLGAMIERIRATEFGRQYASAHMLSPSEVQKISSQGIFEQDAIEQLVGSLESYYYVAAGYKLKSAEPDSVAIRSLLSSEADGKNVLTIMRCKKSGMDATGTRKYLVPGGKIIKSELESMLSASTVDEVAERVAAKFGLQEALDAYKKDSRLTHFEIAFEQSVSRQSVRALHRSVLSVGALAGMLFLKEEEINNIRKIARGTALGMGKEEIREMLVVAR
jgi:V/A-type H+-transporting ATPase subunit C